MRPTPSTYELLVKYTGKQYDLTESSQHPNSNTTAPLSPKNISLAEFYSAANHLVITRAVTTWWEVKSRTWWTTFNGDTAPFLSIRGCKIPDIEGATLVCVFYSLFPSVCARYRLESGVHGTGREIRNSSERNEHRWQHKNSWMKTPRAASNECVKDYFSRRTSVFAVDH